jgi:hypothetical protein
MGFAAEVPGPLNASSHLSVEGLLLCDMAIKLILGYFEAVSRRLMNVASAT